MFSVSLLLILVFSFILPTDFWAQDVISEHAMVATAHPIASTVGTEILKKGGNAVDAAMAIAFALSIAEPNASGIGGGGFLLIKMADQDQPVMIDYREMAPGKATRDYYYQNEASFQELTGEGANAVGVPGLVACAETVLVKYGTMSFNEVLQPAIKLCQDGVKVSKKLNGMIVDNMEKIMKYPATAEIYFRDMLPIEAGETLRNPDLAKTFEMLAEQGGDVFYKGKIAQAIVDEIKKQGGIFTLDDLEYYQAKIRKPVSGFYRGYQIFSSAPPSGGGTHLIELLNIMENYDLIEMGHNTVDYIHVLTEAMKMVYADKSLNAADPDFYDIPVDEFLNKKYARRLRKRILRDKARFDYQPVNRTVRESNSTSHFSIVDERGNVVALTQSINRWFGSGIVVPCTGILLNDHLSDFDKKPGFPNSIEPYKRPTSSIAPTIVLKDGKPFLTLGTPGGTRIISALAQIIINVIDFGMSIDEAIEAPRVHCLKKTLHVEGRIQPEVISQLKTLGHQIKVHDDFDNFFGGAQGILIDYQNHKLYGGADSRRDGLVMGY